MKRLTQLLLTSVGLVVAAVIFALSMIIAGSNYFTRPWKHGFAPAWIVTLEQTVLYVGIVGLTGVILVAIFIHGKFSS